MFAVLSKPETFWDNLSLSFEVVDSNKNEKVVIHDQFMMGLEFEL